MLNKQGYMLTRTHPRAPATHSHARTRAHAHRAICSTPYCFFTATMVTETRLIVTLSYTACPVGFIILIAWHLRFSQRPCTSTLYGLIWNYIMFVKDNDSISQSGEYDSLLPLQDTPTSLQHGPHSVVLLLLHQRCTLSGTLTLPQTHLVNTEAMSLWVGCNAFLSNKHHLRPWRLNLLHWTSFKTPVPTSQ